MSRQICFLHLFEIHKKSLVSKNQNSSIIRAKVSYMAVYCRFGGSYHHARATRLSTLFLNYIRSHCAKNQNSSMLRANVSYMAIFNAISAGDNGKSVFFWK